MLHLSENVNHLDRVRTLLEQTAWPLAVTSQSKGGLILVNRHYSDLIGPGSRLIWPRRFQCQEIYALGKVDLCPLQLPQARQNSLHNRIMGLSILSRILQDFDPLRRACLLVNLLCHRMGLGPVKQADLNLLGGLGRVRPDQIEEAIHRYEQHLRQLGQTERLGDRHHLAWQRHLLALSSDLSLDGAESDDSIPEIDFGSIAEITSDHPLPEDQYELVHL